jgi:hypothetical protein
MNKKFIYIILFLFITILNASATNIYDDEFNNGTLDVKWSFIRDDPANRIMGSSYLQLNITNTDMNAATATSPIIYQNVNGTDNISSVSINLSQTLNTNYEGAGIIYYLDDDNHMSFMRYYGGGGFVLILKNEVANSVSYSNNVQVSGNPLYLNLTKNNGVFHAYYKSLETDSWTDTGYTYTTSINYTKIGILEGGAGSSSGNPQKFDYFHTTLVLSDTQAPIPTFWYGNYQKIGQLGNPQKYVDIVGNVYEQSSITNITYTLNGGINNTLNLGSDGLRLQSTNDFNIELDYSTLLCGNNTVTIYTTDSLSNSNSTSMILNYICGVNATLPYNVYFNTSIVQDHVQIVDGIWTISNNTIIQSVYGYDKMFTFGSENWYDYEVQSTFKFHTPLSIPATSNFAIAMRWDEYTGSNQPRDSWYPIGALMGYFCRSDDSTCKLSIVSGGILVTPPWLIFKIQDNTTVLSPDITYNIKTRVQTLNSTHSNYSMRVWQLGTSEPSLWMSATIKDDNNGRHNGSVAMISYYSDVVYGNISVYNIPADSTGQFTPPTPISCSAITGNFYVNTTCLPGIGYITNSMNKTDGVLWDNSSSFYTVEYSMLPHSWSNISFYAYNNSGTGSINLTSATIKTQIPNNIPIMTYIGNKYVTVNNTLTFTVSATDTDGDHILYDTSATKGTSFNPNTGIYVWTPNSSDIGIYTWIFNSTDNQTIPGIDSESITVTVSNIELPKTLAMKFQDIQNSIYDTFSNSLNIFSLAIMVFGFSIILYGLTHQNFTIIISGITTALIGFSILLIGNYLITSIISILRY